MIRLVEVKNPLQPSDGRLVHEIEWVTGRPVERYVQDVFADTTGLAVSVNGRVIPEEERDAIVLCDGDCIVAVPSLGNSSLLRTLGAIAVLAAAAAVTVASAGAGIALLGLSVSATASVLGGAVSLAGGLIVQGIASLLTPSAKASTPSYAFDGPHSLAQSGTVIPKGYGTFQPGGNIIASFIDIEGPDQYLNVLVNYGYGPCRAIGQIQINGKNAETYQNVQLYTRLGTNNQLPIPNFNRVVNGYPQATECLAGIAVVVPGTGDLTQILQVDIQFPDGVFFHTNDGNIIPAVITYQVQYCVSGTNNWQPVLQPQTTSDVVTYNSTTGAQNNPHAWCAVATDMPPNSGVCYATDNGPHTPGDPWSGQKTVEVFQPNGNHSTYQKTFYGEWQPTNPLLNQVLVDTWSQGYVEFIASSTQVVYNRTSIYGLAPGKYDVQVTKYGSAKIHDDVQFGDNFSPNIGQDVWVHSVNEISLLDLAYPNMILIGVRALATGQLSGSQLNVTAVIKHGLRTLDNNVLPSALQVFEEDNPACVAADMMLDGLYGGGQFPGITTANIDRYIDEWVAWANLNDQLVPDGNGNSIRRHVFNGVFDNESDLWNQLRAVGNMSRAQIMPLGRDYGVYVDQADVPVQIFTMGNIVADSFNETWLSIDDRANQVEISIADQTRYWKQDNPVVYMDPSLQDAGVPIQNVRVDGKGITLPAQAWHRARFTALGNQYLLRSGSFKTDVDSIACRPGNVAILQHDVPQWGQGGRLLTGSTASTLYCDRGDLAIVSGGYSVIVLIPSLLRYAGTVSAAATLTDGTGAYLGVTLNLSSFDNLNRVTRAILTPAGGGAAVDSPIKSSVAGSIVIVPPPGFTPTANMTYQLFDSDVMLTAAVASVVSGGSNLLSVLTLTAPLVVTPPDFSTYFFGPTGSQKLIRIQTITKASENRAKIEWIDYDARQYVDATPIIGETTAITKTNPGVTTLLAAEVFSKVAATYVSNAVLSWKNGPDTVGVSIFVSYGEGTIAISNAQPQMVARLTNKPTGFTYQAPLNVATTFTVVGFDLNDNYAAFSSAPTATITCVGIAANLILGSSFASGFTYWSLRPRAGDTLVPQFTDDGQAQYTVKGSALASPQVLLFQNIQPSKWAVGDYLMISAYFQVAPANSGNSGTFQAGLWFYDGTGTLIYASPMSAQVPLSGVGPQTRAFAAVIQIPARTAIVQVQINVGGPASSPSSMSIAAGTVLTISHLLLEICGAGQTAPSAWADIDASGQILDIFTLGSSTGLRVQGSVLPSFTGDFTYTTTSTTITISWTALVILWPDGDYTYVVNGSMEVTGLTASTTYYAFLYFNILYGGVSAAVPTTPLGTPAILSAAYDPNADAYCGGDGRVQLTKGGMTLATPASGTGTGTGGGTGGGSGGTGSGGGSGGGGRPPVQCTVRGTLLPTPGGVVSNELLKERFDAGDAVYLIGRSGPEKILSARWVPVEHYHLISVVGFAAFGASDSLPLKPEGGEHRWCSLIPSGTRVDTVAGFRVMYRTLIHQPNEVLALELDGPSHEYLVVDGVWTHNLKAEPP